MKELVTWYMQGKVKVNIDKSFALKDSVDALKYVTSRQVKGKVVILP
jgi:NADPH2:quinone reductase